MTAHLIWLVFFRMYLRQRAAAGPFHDPFPSSGRLLESIPYRHPKQKKSSNWGGVGKFIGQTSSGTREAEPSQDVPLAYYVADAAPLAVEFSAMDAAGRRPAVKRKERSLVRRFQEVYRSLGE